MGRVVMVAPRELVKARVQASPPTGVVTLTGLGMPPTVTVAWLVRLEKAGVGALTTTSKLTTVVLLAGMVPMFSPPASRGKGVPVVWSWVGMPLKRVLPVT